MTLPKDQPEHRGIPDKHCGRRDSCPMMTDEAVDEIAEKAATKAIAKMTSHVYQEIGKGVVTKFLWIVGAISVGGYLWLKKQGYL